ncbi:SusD/RagB family nutrient-binding outer membrane lipoprotein [Luteirhabdus pelagi]|uniref:SusD/RagB family nutrient-binding outer membrane lipoprotein n=1 Tax=Luteirhabdus pelagi TaxID=2792783 RepID=UPI00193AACC3|nr:SusD/RagB family nutrient-binding outer membrane lipoprotein [Luteirhabdus pelagi]
MKLFYRISILCLLSLTMISCEDLLKGSNLEDDPNTVGEVPTVNLISQAELVAVYLAESDAVRYGGIFSNYIVGLNNQWAGYENYSFTPTDFDALWSNLYVEGITQARLGKASAQSEADDDAYATALFFEAMFLGELAASFGDVPDSEAGGSTDSPVYDPQAQVLQNVQSLLDEAIAVGGGATFYFSDSSGGTSSGTTLQELAYTLKARYYLLVRNYGDALSAAQNGISNNGDGLYAVHTNSGGAQNLYWQFAFLQRAGDTTTENSYLEELVDTTNDVNRLLDTPGESARYNFYYDENGDYNLEEGVGIFGPDANAPIVSWYENQLILAEAAYRTNNETLARNTLNGVRAELADQYGASFPNSTASGNTLLRHILEEKYITLFPSAQTAHDLARTDNLLGVPLKQGSQLPQRFLYPQAELDANPNAPQPVPSLFTPTPINQ